MDSVLVEKEAYKKACWEAYKKAEKACNEAFEVYRKAGKTYDEKIHKKGNEK